MGLSVCVGLLADVERNDAEGAGSLREHLAFVDFMLRQEGLPQHVEPTDVESWDAQMFGYSGLHYLRRIAAHIDAGLPLPPPGDDKSSGDEILKAYFASVLNQAPGLLKRLFGKTPRFSRSFDHLIVHSDAEGFYLPQDFPSVLFADDKKLPGGMLGSAPRLGSELERLAIALGIPDTLHSQSEELWEAADSQGEGVMPWQKYGIESFSCVVLREACRKSLATGSAIVFC